MGERGPAPKRSDQRRRVNQPEVPIVKAPGAVEVVVPESDPEWHPVAARWFESLALSGQSAFYEPSDWAIAYALAESMSLEFKPQPVVDKDGGVTWVRFPPKAASLAAWLKGAASLLATEGDRRRLQVELTHEGEQPVDPEVAKVAKLDALRGRLAG